MRDGSGHQEGGGGRLEALARIACPASGRTLVLRRAWPRGPGHLLLEYRDEEVSVAGQWFADPGRLAKVAERTAAVAPAGVAFDSGLGVLLQRGGADRRLPALAGVLGDRAATLVVHRPERRAVVHLRRPGRASYVKLFPPGRRLPATPPVGLVRTPEVLAEDGERGMVEHDELAGSSLHDLLGAAAAPGQRGTEAAQRAFRATGRALRALHGAPAPPSIPLHGGKDEAAVTARWVGHALAHQVFHRDDAVRAIHACERARAGLAGLPSTPSPALLHRDLHDKQVLVADGDDVGLLDLDTLAAGDPALDLANLLVHLDLRAGQGHCEAGLARAAGDAFVDGYRPDDGLVERLDAHAATTRLRLACVYAFRPRWRHLAPQLLHSV